MFDCECQWLSTPRGKIRFTQSGPAEGPYVLLISGIAAPLEVFHDIADLLGGAGFRVLRFDLYGRGGSTAPQEPQHIDLFVTQILDLLQALPGNTPNQVHVLGFSLGGAIAAKLADAHPHLVQSLALIAPAGLPRPGGYFWKWFFTIPLLARAFSIMGRFGLSRVFQREIVDWSRRTEVFEYFHREILLPQLNQNSDYARSVLSTVKEAATLDLTQTYQRISTHPRHTLVMWGTQDKTVPFSQARTLRELMPTAQWIVRPDAAHFLLLEHPKDCGQHLLHFLSKTPPRAMDTRRKPPQ